MLMPTIAALCAAAGMMLLSTGVYRLRQRGLTTRRVALLLDDAPSRVTGVPSVPRRRNEPLMELRQIFVQVEAHDHALRGPTIGAAGASTLIGVATVSPFWIFLAALLGILAYALGARERRRRRIESQAMDAMDLLASGLRAGYSVPQAIDLVAKHSPQPTAAEFALTAQEISLGIPLHEAMSRLARRAANQDYELVAIIIRVQHEVGGNLAQILDSVGSTLRERFELRRQVNSLTAQQRLSSMVLTVLPFALLLFLFVTDRSFVDPLFTEPIGRGMLALAGGMVFIGWTIMRSIGRVEV